MRRKSFLFSPQSKTAQPARNEATVEKCAARSAAPGRRVHLHGPDDVRHLHARGTRLPVLHRDQASPAGGRAENAGSWSGEASALVGHGPNAHLVGQTSLRVR